MLHIIFLIEEHSAVNFNEMYNLHFKRRAFMKDRDQDDRHAGRNHKLLSNVLECVKM